MVRFKVNNCWWDNLILVDKLLECLCSKQEPVQVLTESHFFPLHLTKVEEVDGSEWLRQN